jgi:hypothetical protein
LPIITHGQNYFDYALQLTCTLKANRLATGIAEAYAHGDH